MIDKPTTWAGAIAHNHSPRIKARKMINARTQAIAGIGLDDLPDSCVLADYLDALEEMIEEAHEATPTSELLDFAHEAAIEVLEEAGWSRAF